MTPARVNVLNFRIVLVLSRREYFKVEDCDTKFTKTVDLM